MTRFRSDEQRLKDAHERRWYAPIPFEQIHECGAKINEDAVKLALEDVRKRHQTRKEAA